MRSYRMWNDPHPLTTGPEEVWETTAEVVAVLPEYHQVELVTPDGYRLAVGDRTQGISLASLQPGQKLECTVTRHLPRVLAAVVLAGLGGIEPPSRVS